MTCTAKSPPVHLRACGRREYLALYAHKFLAKGTWTPVYALMGAFMLQSGMPLWGLLLFYGIEFGLRGLIAAAAPSIHSRLGMRGTVALANACQWAFLAVLVLSGAHHWVPFAAMVLYSFSCAVYYPYADVLEAAYVHDAHRGSQYGITTVAAMLGSTIGFAAFGAIAGAFSTGVALLIFGGALMASVLPLLMLNPASIGLAQARISDSYRMLSSAAFRPFLRPMLGFQLSIIGNAVVVPLFVFHVVGTTSKFGFVMAGAMFVNTAAALLIGKHIDRFGHARSARLILAASIGANALLGLVPATVIAVFAAQSFGQVAWASLTMSFTTHLQRRFALLGGNMLVLGAAWQMTLCFGEAVALPILALAVWVWGWPALLIGLVMSALGSAIAMWPLLALSPQARLSPASAASMP